jgi:hypothetical protein
MLTNLTDLSFPPFLTHLTLGYGFNQHLTSLPPTLLYLETGLKFDQPLTNLPPSLTHLLLLCSERYMSPLHTLPSSLRVLSLPSVLKKNITLPPSLTSLIYRMDTPKGLDVNALPHTLTSLTLHIIKFVYVFSRLPPSLTSLTLENYNKPLPDLPSSLTRLEFLGNNDQPLPALSHTSLTHLLLNHNFNQRLPVLPPTLTHLVLGEEFNQPVCILPLPSSFFTLYSLVLFSLSPSSHSLASQLQFQPKTPYTPSHSHTPSSW